MIAKQTRPHQNTALTIIASAVKHTINLPTGSGKSLIQSRAIAESIRKLVPKEPAVFVVLTPRILLSNQIYQEIKLDLALNGLDAQYLIVNSGNKSDKSDMKWFEAIRTIEKENGIDYRELPCATSSKVIVDTYQKSKREGVPLVIIGNYQSAASIVAANLPVKDLYCDEAHYLVPGVEAEKDFSKITTDWFPARRKFYFTATLKYTNGDFGMNNEERFGEAFSLLPCELIKAGELVRPRLHLIEVEGDLTKEVDADVNAITNAFMEHRAMLAMSGVKTIAPKLLVVAKGSENLNDIANHPKIKQLIADRPYLQVFDISSAYKPRINGVEVSREEFLRTLQNLGDNDEAIIIHVRILAEGIDVPGITGIMPLNNLLKSTFLQTLGRATRLHPEDRARLYSKALEVEDLHRYVKPYSWVIIPTYGELGSEIEEKLTTIVRELRTYDFNPAEDVFVKVDRGQSIPKALDLTTTPDKKMSSNLSALIFQIKHTIEQEEVANHIEQFKMSLSDVEDLSTLVEF